MDPEVCTYVTAFFTGAMTVFLPSMIFLAIMLWRPPTQDD